MLETTLEGNPGPLFSTVIKEQFERLRESDRFWFENKETG
jgi:dual oxidase